MNEEAALLAAILANLDEDTPRVVFADWLDENGQPERAEFIRVQCRLAREVPANITLSNIDMYCPHDDHESLAWRNEMLPLLQRERELFEPAGVWQFEWMGSGVHSLCRAGSEWTAHLEWFRRGFVENIACEADDWIRNADVIVKQQPIRKVTLTTRPDSRWDKLKLTFKIRNAWKFEKWPGITFNLPSVNP